MAVIKALRGYWRHAWGAIAGRDAVFALVTAALTLLLAILPTGFERPSDGSLRLKARVVSTDNSAVKNYSVTLHGEQHIEAVVLEAPYEGRLIECQNLLHGKSDMDKLFRPGDIALAVIALASDGSIASALLTDFWRIDMQLLLVVAFMALLLFFGGWTGVKSALSFLLTGMVIWKMLIPAFLSGFSPVLASLAVVGVLSFFIIFLVAGFSRTSAAAFLGSMTGTALSALIALVLAEPYRLNGAVRSFSETLRYGGFDFLNIGQIFLAGTFLASSGAFMDLAMDVAASMEEIHTKRPELGFIELVKSGFNVGRKVIGTMSTTLLLAYTGGFTSMLMVFMAQGVPLVSMLNMSYVSSELFHTMMGSLGLVCIAPITAVLSAALLTRKLATARAEGAKMHKPDFSTPAQVERLTANSVS